MLLRNEKRLLYLARKDNGSSTLVKKAWAGDGQYWSLQDKSDWMMIFFALMELSDFTKNTASGCESAAVSRPKRKR